MICELNWSTGMGKWTLAISSRSVIYSAVVLSIVLDQFWSTQDGGSECCFGRVGMCISLTRESEETCTKCAILVPDFLPEFRWRAAFCVINYENFLASFWNNACNAAYWRLPNFVWYCFWHVHLYILLRHWRWIASCQESINSSLESPIITEWTF